MFAVRKCDLRQARSAFRARRIITTAVFISSLLFASCGGEAQFILGTPAPLPDSTATPIVVQIDVPSQASARATAKAAGTAIAAAAASPAPATTQDPDDPALVELPAPQSTATPA